jgi:hypothetical protein
MTTIPTSGDWGASEVGIVLYRPEHTNNLDWPHSFRGTGTWCVSLHSRHATCEECHRQPAVTLTPVQKRMPHIAETTQCFLCF